MKEEDAIQKAADRVKVNSTKYPGMTYEEGVCEALEWVLGEIPDEEFEYAND